MTDVTAVLVSWRRPENVYRLVDALRGQTVEPELMLLNNLDVATYGVEQAASIPWNAGPMVRHLFAPCATTPWVMYMDDDLMPGDDGFVEDALEVAAERPDGISGAWGRTLHRQPPHYRDGYRAVPIIIGRFWLFRRELLKRVHLPPMDAPHIFRCDDIYVSLEIGGGEPVHWADAGLRGRLEDLPDGGADVALSLQDEHIAKRNEFCRWWLENRA